VERFCVVEEASEVGGNSDVETSKDGGLTGVPSDEVSKCHMIVVPGSEECRDVAPLG